MSKNLLLIFTRNPELGKAKTRLAKTVGDETALEIYKFLLQKTRDVSLQVNADKAVYYSVKVRENDIWDAKIYQKHQQFGEDLGIRMLNAFKNGFDLGYEKVMIIGSDLYNLSSENIDNAFLQLDNNDVVIGPAEDGGYYLLGMNALQEKVFKNKSWGTETVRKDTLLDLKNKKVKLLAFKNDIDVYEDIIDIPEIMSKFINVK
ncbi:TIGR04282 family arsenosugar biosynthesis glycosyltransferase [Polaribacter vadi]|uniref:TIGR04282 family arsenosugar biosynthesis glycosyltransferase n=1 Tax=Polaribacter TaxID=52959 RepID=UPI001C0911BF|nr:MULTISPECIES: TIGR04282 family arsenosugar biosynthesis glycosyltransferase [Polaribacter]MBU3010658.1 TIGR04282 family arsenosugar biosynthesis glycosyltransferase [Polaribacter vadi]MDO6740469.1 TIGR04282 family arsenosugar biosynthesis glycosyltransferase [Polaribacter sp. 1_MG-2023]